MGHEYQWTSIVKNSAGNKLGISLVFVSYSLAILQTSLVNSLKVMQTSK